MPLSCSPGPYRAVRPGILLITNVLCSPSIINQGAKRDGIQPYRTMPSNLNRMRLTTALPLTLLDYQMTGRKDAVSSSLVPSVGRLNPVCARASSSMILTRHISASPATSHLRSTYGSAHVLSSGIPAYCTTNTVGSSLLKVDHCM